MSDYPITPQQDYLSIFSTTGKGFTSQVPKFSVNVPDLLPITAPGGATVTGSAISTPFVNVSSGGLVTTTTGGILFVDFTYEINTPVLVSTYMLVLPIRNGAYEYRYCYGPSAPGLQYAKCAMNFAPGDNFSLYISKGDSAVTVITPRSYNIRLF